MDFLEKDLENFIFEKINTNNTSEIHDLHKRGFFFNPMRYYRQVNLGSYGIADIVGFKIEKKQNNIRKLNVCIIELKKDNVDFNTLLQALDYAKGIERVICHNGYNLIFQEIKYSFILIGNKIDKTSFVYMPDFIPNISIYKYDFSLDKGLYFEMNGNYKLSEEKEVSTYRYEQDIKQGLWHSSNGRFINPTLDQKLDNLPF